MTKRKTERPSTLPIEPMAPPDAQTVVHQELRPTPGLPGLPGVVIHREPLVVPAIWPDHADTTAHAKKKGARLISGWRRASTILALHNGSPREITEAHVKAANRLLGDYELGVEGATQDGHQGERVDGKSAGGITDARLDAVERYRDAVRAMGEQASLIVSLVVIDNWTMTRLAASIGTTRDRAFGMLQGGLERLREHYAPPRENAASKVSELAAVDPDVVDVAQERLGRWRRQKAMEDAS